jgi:integrase/recombinase XerD
MVARMKTSSFRKSLHRLLNPYLQHLEHVGGLRPQTGVGYATHVRDFLCRQRRRIRRRLDLRRLKPTAVVDYLVQRQGACQPGTLHALTTALRSFFKYLVFAQQLRADQVPVIPRVSTGSSGAADYLQPDELQRFLARFDRRTKLGRRDYALTLCLARLGLRAGEVARLQLEDLDWRRRQLCLRRPKGRRERVLPLPSAVGSALAEYLQKARPTTAVRQVFVHRSGQGPLSPSTIGWVVRQALRRAQLTKRPGGAHLLRHTVASQLVQRGVSLKAIADLLGHRDVNTTLRYAHVHRSRLQSVVQPWPQEVA